ncbi:hypothetical protein M0R45_019057 [Rubus argutus]|uniref:Uncharacterized protein n=1 Tax=Rubus argutus TaxID=59490 RepID=A0AAW1X4E4_RUBAR
MGFVASISQFICFTYHCRYALLSLSFPSLISGLKVTIGKTKLDSGRRGTRDRDVTVTGVQLTTTHPPSIGPTSPWVEAVVPQTVLATLVKSKELPDPFYGLEMESIINIADSGRQWYTFWLFTAFQYQAQAQGEAAEWSGDLQAQWCYFGSAEEQ